MTTKGSKHSSVNEEIDAILQHSNKDHVILIGDVRMFVGKNGNPELVKLEEKISMIRPCLNITVEKDMMRIVKKVR